MTTNDIADPTTQQADRRDGRPRPSLRSRVELFKHRLIEVRNALDPQAQIAKHPLSAVGIAFALGVVAGLRRTRPAPPEDAAQRSLGSAALAGLAALGLRIARDLAIGHLGYVANQWWTQRDGVSPAEPGGSRMVDLEPFLEH